MKRKNRQNFENPPPPDADFDYESKKDCPLFYSSGHFDLADIFHPNLFLCSDDEVDEKCAIIFNTCKEMYKKKATGISANETIVDENESRSKDISKGKKREKDKHKKDKYRELKHTRQPQYYLENVNYSSNSDQETCNTTLNEITDLSKTTEFQLLTNSYSTESASGLPHISKKLKSLNYNEDSIAVSPNYLRDLIPTDGEYSKKRKLSYGRKTKTPDLQSNKHYRSKSSKNSKLKDVDRNEQSRSHYSAQSDSPDVDSDKIKSSHHSRKHKTKSYRSKRSDAESDDEYYKTRSSYSKRSESLSTDSDDDRYSQSKSSRYSKKSRYSDDDRCNKEVEKEMDEVPKEEYDFIVPDEYYCKICDIYLNTNTFHTHMTGKKHAKMKKANCVEKLAKLSLNKTIMNGSFYINPPPGMVRIELPVRSKIQNLFSDIDRPVVGLKYVWEIRRDRETLYFCSLCESPCGAMQVMSHLTGYKHRVSYFKKNFLFVFERVENNPKYEIEREMEKYLDKVPSREKIRVFEEIPIKCKEEPGTSKQSESWKNQELPFIKKEKISEKEKPGCSWKSDSQKNHKLLPSKEKIFVIEKEDPNTMFSDLYCDICDAHMNTRAMWESHIVGKRHLKNKKKLSEGNMDVGSKLKLAPEGTLSRLNKMISEELSDTVVVGLSYIRENILQNGYQFTCFLCCAVCTVFNILDHIVNFKHKLKYLEKLHVDGYETSIKSIKDLQVSNSAKQSLVDEECLKMMDQYGSGTPQIYLTKK
ncbi:uncharacterized protein CDAR_377841 [Caerostris darwini]|uniref:U1-type domain-containing protein n=1 Tax=Caerostris darwini TaxID=1538125 RepID=A0AAV4NFT8_9ARAC|nr:uncharacterized protein CDAR_377841 [Caerostris darwini]